MMGRGYILKCCPQPVLSTLLTLTGRCRLHVGGNKTLRYFWSFFFWGTRHENGKILILLQYLLLSLERVLRNKKWNKEVFTISSTEANSVAGQRHP